MRIQVRLFASLREEVGQEVVELEVPEPATVQALLDAFETRYPKARSVGNVLVAVNEAIARPDTRVQPGDRLALLPPVSGGGDVKRVVREDLDADAVLEALRSPRDGATVTFLGTVRGTGRGREVTVLRYEVYEAMADRVIRRIEEEVARKTGAHRVLVQHRVGDLRPGERTVLVAASAPHRGEAFEACRLALERVKTEVPVWKKEVYADGSEAWVEAHGEHAPTGGEGGPGPSGEPPGGSRA